MYTLALQNDGALTQALPELIMAHNKNAPRLYVQLVVVSGAAYYVAYRKVEKKGRTHVYTLCTFTPLGTYAAETTYAFKHEQ
jgi:uncharacterized membrane protein